MQVRVSLTRLIAKVVKTTVRCKLRAMVIPQIFRGGKASIMSPQLTKFRQLPPENGFILCHPDVLPGTNTARLL